MTACKRLSAFISALSQGARLMVGLPDYKAYLAHMREFHPDRPAMAYADFFRERQNARYGALGKGGFRCC